MRYTSLIILVLGLAITQLACSSDDNTGGANPATAQNCVLDSATQQCLPQAVANEVGPNSQQVAAARALDPNLGSMVLTPNGNATASPTVTAANAGTATTAAATGASTAGTSTATTPPAVISSEFPTTSAGAGTVATGYAAAVTGGAARSPAADSGGATGSAAVR